MHDRQPTLMEVLKPRRFRPNPQRDQVTRTVVQPVADEIEAGEVSGARRPRPIRKPGGIP